MNKFKVGDRVNYVGPDRTLYTGILMFGETVTILNSNNAYEYVNVDHQGYTLQVARSLLTLAEERTMTRKEAVLAMLDGKKVRRDRDNQAYMIFDTRTGFTFVSASHASEPIKNALSDADGYKLYEEPLEEITVNGQLYRKVK